MHRDLQRGFLDFDVGGLVPPRARPYLLGGLVFAVAAAFIEKRIAAHTDPIEAQVSRIAESSVKIGNAVQAMQMTVAAHEVRITKDEADQVTDHDALTAVRAELAGVETDPSYYEPSKGRKREVRNRKELDP